MPSKKTTAQFLKDAVGVHGAKYDYSLVKYVNSSTKLIIKCSEHGEFQQSPNAHLRGSGCRKCGSPTLTPPLKTVDQLMNLWDEETNIVDPKTLLAGSNIVANWKCQHGQTWKRRIVEVYGNDNPCAV